MPNTYQLIALDEYGVEQGRYPVATLPFNPGDMLVVTVDRATTRDAIEHLRAELYKRFPSDRVIIASDAVRFLRLEAID